MVEGLEERIRNCDSLPVLPEAATRVLELAPNNEVGLAALALVIAADPIISAGVLRSINSPFYGLANHVTDIRQAVALLGPQSVKALVLSHSLGGIVNAHRGKGFNHLTFWRRGMYSSAAARVLAARVLPTQVEDCFISALLMDLGTLVLDQLLGDQYKDVYRRATTHDELLAIESQELGTTHARAGGILAQHWHLPAVMETAMTAHHEPDTVEDPALHAVTQVTSVAGHCADVFVGEKPAESIATVRAKLGREYQIEPAETDRLLGEIGHKAVDLAKLFNVSLTPVDYEAILVRASQRLLELSLGVIKPVADTSCNRRRAARMRRDGDMTIIPCERGILGAPLKIRLRDLSASGLGFICRKQLPRGTQFVIQVSQNGMTKSLLYSVARCKRTSGTYEIGAQLASVLVPNHVPPATSLAAV